MTPSERQQFLAALTALADTYGLTLSPVRTEMYFQALADLPLPTVQGAILTVVRTHVGNFMPTPGQIRTAAGESPKEAGELAWLALLEAFQRGYYATALPADPITHALVRVFWGDAERARDWWNGCHDRALEDRHREFVGRYGEYARRPRTDLPRLPGVAPGPVRQLEAGS
jgi:hypothetical protein